MMKQDTNGELPAEAASWVRVCDTCRAAACVVYCRADSAYLCAGCDARVHAANRVASRHERVWVCEACERAPAAFICKADAASLCASCDADIHSANPLARRHHRVPVLPISGSVHGPSAKDVFDEDIDEDDNEDEDETASWLLLNPVKTTTGININNNNQGSNYNNNNNNNNNTTNFLFGGEVDEYLDLAEYNNSSTTGDNDQNHQFGVDHDHFNTHQQMMSYGHVPQKNYAAAAGTGDSVVPVQCSNGDIIGKPHMMQQSQGFHLGLEFDSPKAAYSSTSTYNGSISHTVRSFLPIEFITEFEILDQFLIVWVSVKN